MFVVPFREEDELRKQTPRVVEHLREGGLILYPTETVYGLGCLADAEPVERVAELKGRQPDQTFLLLAPAADLPGVRWSEPGRALAEAFWPGPLTLILDAEPGAFPAGVVSADGGVALRVSPHPAVARLLDELAAPVISTSANLTGEEPARTVEEALELVKRLPEDADIWFLNGGDAPGGTPSTIVDARHAPVRLVRAGAIDESAVRSVVDELAS